MSDTWPTEVFDCALRLAKSLGYRDDHILAKDGQVYVNYPSQSADWRPLDPRNPNVWSALIDKNKVRKVSYWRSGIYAASLTLTKFYDALARDPGLAVCEAYNALKGNIKCTTSK